MEPDEIHPRVVRELSEVTVRPFSVIIIVLETCRDPSELEASRCYSCFEKGKRRT